MEMTKTIDQREKVELHGTLAEFRQALEEEIAAIKKRGLTSTLLSGGVKIPGQAGKFFYKYHAEYVPTMPADTPCKLIIGQEQYTVVTVSFDAETITLASEQPLPDGFSSARLENGSTVLMECMIQCIEENAEKENQAGRRMLNFNNHGVVPFKKIASFDNPKDSKLNEKQREAVISALTNDITYIWGPPGTGKTAVIGQIIDQLRQNGRSVLTISHTNTAVDGAIEKAVDAYQKSSQREKENEPYPILRIGKPVKKLPDETTLEFHIKMNGKELYQKKKDLESKREELQQQINEILRKQKRFEWVENTQLPSVPEALSELKTTESHLASLKARKEALQKEVDEEKERHPETEQYISLSALLEKAGQQYENAEEQLNATYEIIKSAPDQILLAKDEIKKHDIYAGLLREEEKTFSSVFINREIASLNEEIQNLQSEISTFNCERNDCQKTIMGYEKKSAIGKFFAGKSGVNQAKAKMEEIDAHLLDLQEKFNQMMHLSEDYKNQLRNRLELENQLQRLKPKQTQEYWKRAIADLTHKLNHAKKSISDLENEKASTAAKKHELQTQLSAIQETYYTLQSLEETLRQIQSAYEHTKTEKLQIEYRIKGVLKEEHALYEACSGQEVCIDGKDFFEQYRALKSCLKKVSEHIQKENAKDLEAQHIQFTKKLGAVLKQLEALEGSLGELKKQSIMQAKVVGATLTKAYLSSVLRERTFDTVILDEASMAAIPALWCAAYLAERNIVIVGDFLQLPPIVIADTPMAKKWLGKDIFYHSGMQERVKEKDPPKNFVMLNEQYRMEPEIAEIANRYYVDYKQKLKSMTGPKYRQKAIGEFESWFPAVRPKHNVQLIDTESLHAWVTGIPQGKGHSRLNCFSAAVAVDLAFKCIEKKLDAYMKSPEKGLPEKPLVLIVAPYKPHVVLVNQLIQAEYNRRGFIKETDTKSKKETQKKADLNFIQAGTIHSFQGGEADIVIFDLVIDEPHWKANLFMNTFVDKKTGERVDINEDLKKMFNVAITRAKFQLFIIGDFQYCLDRTKSSENELYKLLNFLLDEKKYKKQDAKELFPELTYAPPISRQVKNIDSNQMLICTEASFEKYFEQELITFKDRMIIYSPFMTERRIGRLKPFFQDACKVGKEIIIITKDLSERGKTERSAYEMCEKGIKDCGDSIHIIHKHGMHEKLILADDDVIWMGSLNALSFTGNTGEIMERRCSEKLVEEYEKIYDIQKISNACRECEMTCPICGGEMLIKESNDGGIYWQCVNKDYSRNADQPYPKDGIFRCRCGAAYEFSMKKEPRWVCTKNPKHYQKIRESDLKLEKMRALIPPKDLKAVKKYFESRNKKGAKKEQKPKNSKVGKDEDQLSFYD